MFCICMCHICVESCLFGRQVVQPTAEILRALGWHSKKASTKPCWCRSESRHDLVRNSRGFDEHLNTRQSLVIVIWCNLMLWEEFTSLCLSDWRRNSQRFLDAVVTGNRYGILVFRFLSRSGPFGELCACFREDQERIGSSADSTEALLAYRDVRERSRGKGKRSNWRSVLFSGWLIAKIGRRQLPYRWTFYFGTLGEAIRSWLCACWLFCDLSSRWSFCSQNSGFGTDRRDLFALGSEVCITFLLSSRACAFNRFAFIDRRSFGWPCAVGWFGGVLGSLQLPVFAGAFATLFTTEHGRCWEAEQQQGDARSEAWTCRCQRNALIFADHSSKTHSSTCWCSCLRVVVSALLWPVWFNIIHVTKLHGQKAFNIHCDFDSCSWAIFALAISYWFPILWRSIITLLKSMTQVTLLRAIEVGQEDWASEASTHTSWASNTSKSNRPLAFSPSVDSSDVASRSGSDFGVWCCYLREGLPPRETRRCCGFLGNFGKGSEAHPTMKINEPRFRRFLVAFWSLHLRCQDHAIKAC